MRLLSQKRHRCLFDEAHASKHRIRKDCTQQRLPAVEEKKKENNVVVEVVMITLLSVMWFSQPLVVNITELPSRILPRSCLHIDGAEPETNARIGNQRNN